MNDVSRTRSGLLLFSGCAGATFSPCVGNGLLSAESFSWGCCLWPSWPCSCSATETTRSAALLVPHRYGVADVSPPADVLKPAGHRAAALFQDIEPAAKRSVVRRSCFAPRHLCEPAPLRLMAGSILVWILVLTDILAVRVVVTAAVVVVVVPVGSVCSSSCCADSGGAVSRASRIISASVSRDRATGVTRTPGNGTPAIAGTTSDRMRGPGTSRNTIAATTIRAASAATMEAASPHAASVESATATESTTSTTTSGEGFLWNQAGSDEDERCQRSEYISKHGLPPYLGAVRRWSDAERPRVGTWPEHFAIDEAGFDLDQTAGQAALLLAQFRFQDLFLINQLFLIIKFSRGTYRSRVATSIMIDRVQTLQAIGLKPPTSARD